MGHFRKQQVTVFPTNMCNMRCLYCAGSSADFQDRPQQIDMRFARKGIADYFSDGIKHQIRFYCGGEPTQAIEIVKECWEYAASLVGDRLVSEIQTNCHFDDATAGWLGAHLDIVWASVDGWENIQNRYRPVPGDPLPSERVMQNARQIAERTFVGIRCTIVPETVHRQAELVHYFADLGFSHIVSEPVFAPVRNEQESAQGAITGVDMHAYILGFVDAWHEAEQRGVSYTNSFMVNFDEKVQYACRSCLPTPHLTTDGYVSACDLGFYGGTPLKDLIYGKYDSGTDAIDYWPESIARLRSRRCANIKACDGCSAREFCGGGCLGRAYHETRDFYGVVDDYCWATRYLMKKLPMDRIRIDRLHP
jgi:uncharacterized protein